MVFRKRTNRSVQTETQTVYSGSEELFDLEESLAGYNMDLVSKMAKGLGLDKNLIGIKPTLVEFGAGTGTLAQAWRDAFNLDPICVEIDSELLKILNSRSFRTYPSVQKIPSEIGFVYTSNVLEHIEDDVRALMEIRSKMPKGGKIAIYVPALPILFSDMDRRVGHFRRYRKRELLAKVRAAGFDVQSCFFNDSIGVLASFTLKIVGFKNRANLGSRKSLLLYDTYIYPVSKLMDRLFFKHLIGKNLFLFAINLKD
jgi:SAM-dependent methyltransferase